MNVWTFLGFSEPYRKENKTVQLVKHWDDVNDKNKKFPYIVQTKLDGVYAMLVVLYGGEHAGQRKIFSRTGNEFTNTDHILNNLKILPPGVYIGEMINKGCSLEVLSGMHNTNRTKPLTFERKITASFSEIMFHDHLLSGEFICGSSALHYTGRCQRLRDTGMPVGRICKSSLINSQEQLDYIFSQALKDKQEGVVIKRDTGWDANHKGWRMMKLVKGISLDLRVKSIEEGKVDTKREGMANKVYLLWIDPDGNADIIKADLGKGWTDEMRIELLKDPSIIVDKIVEVTAFGKSSKGKLRQPKVGHVRIDKNEPDI